MIVLLSALALCVVMLGVTVNYPVGWNGGAATPISISPTLTEPVESSGDFTLASATSDQNFVIGINHTKLQSLLITSTVPCVIYTNAAHSGSPAQTFSCDGNAPAIYWVKSQPVTADGSPQNQLQANPITTDITSLYVSVPGATAGTLRVRATYLS